MKRIFVLLMCLLLVLPLTACGGQEGLQDGYYTAQMSQFSHGDRKSTRLNSSHMA